MLLDVFDVRMLCHSLWMLGCSLNVGLLLFFFVFFVSGGGEREREGYWFGRMV